MKISNAKKVHLESGPNMTPLVDVVMVILIFLMLAGSFGGLEHYLTSNLPPQLPGGSRGRRPFDQTQLDIRVDGSAQAGNPNFWVARVGDVTSSNAGDLRTQLTGKRVALENAGAKVDDIQVIINPNRFVKWQSLVSVYQAAMESKFTKIAFSTAH